jgi:hypothetical protein
MNKHKQFHFIAVFLLAFALSLALAPVCYTQEAGSNGSDSTGDTGSDEMGSGSDQADTGSADVDLSGLSVFQAAGPNPVPADGPQSIQSTVDAFRAALGEPNNGNAAGPLDMGRREINWDGGGNVDVTTDPVTPFNVFLNTRGAQFTTPGKGLSQAPPQGGPQNGLVGLFSNPTYGAEFSTFSPLRLFTPVGSNVTEALFFVPVPAGMQGPPATVRGFGVVFTDVDRPDGKEVDSRRSRRASTFIEYFDAQNRLIFRGIVPPDPGTKNMSFFGIVLDHPIIARVRITTGNSAPGPDDGSRDIVMMDDFIYGEPQMAP